MQLGSNKGRLAWRAAFFLFPATLFAQPQPDDPAAISRRVKELMSQGRFEQAIPLCEQLVKALPGNTGLLLNLGLAQQMAGHPDKALPVLDQVLKAEPENVPALNSFASAALQVGEPKAAVPPLRKLRALQPSNLETLRMLAGALLGSGDLDEAAAQYRKLTGQAPADTKAWYGLGKTYQEQSARLFDRLEKHGPQSAYVAALIGASRLKAQQYHSAFFFFREAARFRPPIRGVHSGLAVIYRKAGHADWAAFEEKQEDDLPAPDCAAYPSECLFVQNRYAEAAKAAGAPAASDSALYWAVKAYDQLALEVFARLEALPESVEVHALHAQLAHGNHQDLEAAAEWRAALKLSPGNPRLESELAMSLFMARDYTSAIPLIEKQMRGDARSPNLNFMMGESLLRTEQPDQAIPYLEAALRVNPNMLPAHASLGLSLAKLDRGRDAIPHLEKALDLDDDGALHYQLAQAYRKAGDNARADTLTRQYQEIQKRNTEDKEEITKDVQITAPVAN